jgi:nucleotide-binding universal stress UspA family protein
MSKIVLAISDRWVPDARVEAIGDFANRLGHSIFALHVAYGSEADAAGGLPGERTLERIAQHLRSKNAKVETQMLFSDDLGDAILRTAEAQKAAMIMLGLSSKGMLTRLIEGNIAQQIIRNSDIPLFLLPHDWKLPL